MTVYAGDGEAVVKHLVTYAAFAAKPSVVMIYSDRRGWATLASNVAYPHDDTFFCLAATRA